MKKDEIFDTLIEKKQNEVRTQLIESYISNRKQKKLTQADIAKRLGTARQNITRFENGTYNPTLDFLVKVADGMNMEVQIELVPQKDSASQTKHLMKYMTALDGTDNPLLVVLREEMSMRLKGGIYHTTQVKLAYNSNHIEGSRLSEEQTRYIYETNTIGVDSAEDTLNVDDIVETNNHFDAFRYLLFVANADLSESIIRNFHRILKTGTSDGRKDWFPVGEYKAKPNMVGNRETTKPKDVPAAMEKLLSEYHAKENKTIEDLIDFHFQFECIHPFQDGNGRVGRLILFKECLKYGFTPIIIEDQYKQFYYRGLNEYETEPGYLIDTCLHGQDVYAKLMEYFEVADKIK